MGKTRTMEHFEISQKNSVLHIEGFPDAVKVISIGGPLAKHLSDLALHKADLEFADKSLDAINLAPEEPFEFREALWRSAIVHFLKCFGSSGARFQLSSKKILKAEPPEAQIVFDYFKNLRNKHLVHDENSYAQSIPGAILNDGSKDYKIEKVVCLASIAVTLSQDNYSNLKRLIQQSYAWVIAEFDKLADSITNDLEKESYEKLLSKEPMKYYVPSNDDIDKNRNLP